MRANKKVKMRKSIRYFYLASSILILVCSSSYLLKTLISAEDSKVRNKEIYSYKNAFNYEYKVDLLKNPYIDKDYLEMKEEAYITDLIESINLNLNYKYDANIESNIEYEYTVKGFLEATYTKDGEVQKVWEKEYVLLEPKKEIKNTDIIDIKENLNLNLKKENDLVKQFEQEMGMNIDAKYIVRLEVKTNTNVENEKINNKYISSLNIDLAEKTTKIEGENNKEDKKLDRWNKILKEASEQSKRVVIPFVNEIKDIKDLIKLDYDIKILCTVNELSMSLKEVLEKNLHDLKILLVIGPEGGFTDTEEKILIENGFISTSFGSRVLRTETASLYALSIINYIFM